MKTTILMVIFLALLCPKVYADADSWEIREIEKSIEKKKAPDSIVIIDEPALFLVAREGRVDLAQKLIEMGANVNKQATMEGICPDKSKWKKASLIPGRIEIPLGGGSIIVDPGDYPYTALMVAAKAGKAEVLKLLLEKGADPLVKTSRGDTAISYAAASGDKDVLMILLNKTGKKGSDLDDDLIRAVNDGHKDVVKVLLEKGADVNFSIDVGGEPYTPLRYALAHGYSDIAEMLKKAHPKINHYDDLISAVTEGNAKAVEKLLGEGTNPNMENSFGPTPIEIASRLGNLEIVRILAEYGANLNGHEFGPGAVTPLMVASSKGNLEIVKFLLEKGVDVNYSSERGHTALEGAAFNGHLDVVNYLLGKGADVTAGIPDAYYSLAADKTGPNEAIKSIRVRLDVANELYDSLVTATQRNDLRQVVQLLNKGAKPDRVCLFRQHEYLSPLQIAAQNGYVEIARVLMAHHAETHIASSHDPVSINTPLQLAARGGHVDIVKLLVSDPSVYLDDSNGGTPTALMYACQNNQKDIVDLLINNGADVERKNKEGKTALDIAQASGNKDIVKLIRNMDKSKNQIMRMKRRRW
jgi:ankyrin repeat protein